MQMLDATRGLPADEKEEFYNEVNEWTYQQYEEALLRQEPEMQNHEEEG